jgi:hypothetical protein
MGSGIKTKCYTWPDYWMWDLEMIGQQKEQSYIYGKNRLFEFNFQVANTADLKYCNILRKCTSLKHRYLVCRGCFLQEF